MDEKTQKGQEQQQFLIMPFARGIIDFANVEGRAFLSWKHVAAKRR